MLLQDALYNKKSVGFCKRLSSWKKKKLSSILHKNTWSFKFWHFICEMLWHKLLTFKPQNNPLTDKSEIWGLLVEMLKSWLLYGVKLYKPNMLGMGGLYELEADGKQHRWEVLTRDLILFLSPLKRWFLLQYSTCLWNTEKGWALRYNPYRFISSLWNHRGLQFCQGAVAEYLEPKCAPLWILVAHVF